MAKKKSKNKAAAKAWRLYRASLKGKKSASGSKTAKVKSYVKRQGIGGFMAKFRYADVMSRPIQGSLSAHGLNKDGLMSAGARYSGGLIRDGELDAGSLMATYGGIATGSVWNKIKSRLGVYRGMSQFKWLSLIQGFLPEIQALQHADPLTDFKGWNDWRMSIDGGYSGIHNKLNIVDDPTGDAANAFWNDKAITLLLTGAQKLLFNTNGPVGLNRYMPKFCKL